MVVHVVRNARDAIDERNAVGKSREGECLHQRMAAPGPTIQGAQRAVNLDVGELTAHGSDLGHGGFYSSRADSKDPSQFRRLASGYVRYRLLGARCRRSGAGWGNAKWRFHCCSTMAPLASPVGCLSSVSRRTSATTAR